MLQDLFLAYLSDPTTERMERLGAAAAVYSYRISSRVLGHGEQAEIAALEAVTHLLKVGWLWNSHPERPLLLDYRLGPGACELVLVPKAGFDARKYIQLRMLRKSRRMKGYNEREVCRRDYSEDGSKTLTQDDTEGSAVWMEQQRQVQELRDMVRLLPASLPEIMQLTCQDGLNSREVADRLNVHHSTISRRVQQGVELLKEMSR